MDTTQTTTSPTTSAAPVQQRRDLIFSLHYGHRYGARLSRMYGRIACTLRFSEVVLGSGAAAAYLAKQPETAVICAGLLAVIGAINIAFDPAARAKDAVIEAEKFGVAIAASRKQSDSELEDAVSALQSHTRPEIESLREPVWRDVVSQLGLPLPATVLTKRQRFFSLIA